MKTGRYRTAFLVIALVSLFAAGCADAPTTVPTLAVPSATAEPADTGTPAPTAPETQAQEPAEVETATVEASPTVEEAAIPLTACTAPAALTPSMTEGPYYTPGSPERTVLYEEGIPGTKLILTGYVLDADCQPVPGAWLDFWQTDGAGVYDNEGYRLRGHQFTDEQGRYRLETVVPGIYPGRTAHIHLKVQAPGGPVLTSQLFIPGVSQNESDRIFDNALVVTILSEGEVVEASYNFVVVAQ